MNIECRLIEETHSSEPTDRPKEKIGPGEWSRQLASDGEEMVVVRDQTLALVDAAGNCLWPEPYLCKGIPEQAHISKQRLLITTSSLDYTAWGVLGPALLLNRHDGSLITELRGRRGIALKGGHFLLGLAGYDVFDTWRYDHEGLQIQQWRSYGHYIDDPDEGIRVIEFDLTTPTRARVVKLLPDGSIERGPHLKDGQVSAPVLLMDGTALFMDAGVLRAVDRNLGDNVLQELMALSPRDCWRFSTDLFLDGDVLTIQTQERTKEPPIDYKYHQWVLKLINLGHSRD